MTVFGFSLTGRGRSQRQTRLGAVACSLALLAVILPLARPPAAEAAAQVEDGPETIFLLDHPIPLDRVATSLASSGLRPVSFEHTGSSRGGFEVGDLPLEAATESYQRSFEASGGTEGQPQVFSFRVAGDVSAEPMGDLAELVVATRAVDAGRPAVVVPVDPQSRQGKAVTPRSLRKKLGSAVNLRPSTGSLWSPTAGTVAGYEVDGLRVIRHTMSWTDQSQLESFGEVGAYEHNFKLYDYGNPSPGLRPGCLIEDFWVQRSIAMFWSTTYPDAAGAYLDTDRDDPCSEADLSIGVYKPQFLSAGVEYTTYFAGLGGPTAQSSPFSLGAQRAPRNCDLPFVHIGLNNPNCVGLWGAPISDYVSMIPDFPGRCSVPISPKPWTAGTEGTCLVETDSLVSRGFLHTQGNSTSSTGSRTEDGISRGGRFVVFDSHAHNLVPNDTNGHTDVFVRDMATERNERVSVSSTGEEGNSQSAFGGISSNGRYVTFVSYATNFAPGTTGARGQIYVHDRETDTTTLVSVGYRDIEGNSGSWDPAISDDGRYVVFASEATNLSRTPTGGMNVFLRDVVRGRTIRLAGTWDNDSSISGDGRFVVLATPDALIPEDQNNVEDVYRYEIATGSFVPVSISPGGVWGDWDSNDPAVSTDGRYVVFHSMALNLAPTGPPPWRSWSNIILKDMVTGATKVVSVDSGGTSANGSSFNPGVSDDGRHVVFQSEAYNLVPGDAPWSSDVFVHDMVTGETKLQVGKAGLSTGTEAWREFAGNPVISPDGVFVAFDGQGVDLLEQDHNGMSPDVFITARR